MTSPLQQKIKITGPCIVTANRTREIRARKSQRVLRANARVISSRKALLRIDDFGVVRYARGESLARQFHFPPG